MKILFKKIYEHDMDLLILEEFLTDRGFAKLFLDKVGLPVDYDSCEGVHSYSDEDGESDITFILQYGNRKKALLIENKIDAPTMKEQSERYKKRGEKGKTAGLYEEYRILLAAPRAYHKEHANDPNANYENRIEHEEMEAYLRSRGDGHAGFKAEMLAFAIKEKKTGYLMQENQATTEFWRALKIFCEEKYPDLALLYEGEGKGGRSIWPQFRTSLGNIKVVYKSEKGSVELEFPGYGEKTGDLRRLTEAAAGEPLQIRKAGKAASIYKYSNRWVTDFSRPFVKQEIYVNEVLQVVEQLCVLAGKLNLKDIYP